MSYTWQPVNVGDTFTLNHRDSGAQAFTATRCDLIFGANQQLLSVAEVYASNTGAQRFAGDFVAV